MEGHEHAAGGTENDPLLPCLAHLQIKPNTRKGVVLFDADGCIIVEHDEMLFTFEDILRHANTEGWDVAVVTGRSQWQIGKFLRGSDTSGIPSLVIYENGAFVSMSSNGETSQPFLATTELIQLSQEVRKYLNRWEKTTRRRIQERTGRAIMISYFGRGRKQVTFSFYLLDVTDATEAFLQRERERVTQNGVAPLDHMIERERRAIRRENRYFDLEKMRKQLQRYLSRKLGTQWETSGGCLILSDSALQVGWHNLIHKGRVVELFLKHYGWVVYVGDAMNDLPAFEAVKNSKNGTNVAVVHEGTPDPIKQLAHFQFSGKGNGALALSILPDLKRR